MSLLIGDAFIKSNTGRPLSWKESPNVTRTMTTFRCQVTNVYRSKVAILIQCFLRKVLNKSVTNWSMRSRRSQIWSKISYYYDRCWKWYKGKRTRNSKWVICHSFLYSIVEENFIDFKKLTKSQRCIIFLICCNDNSMWTTGVIQRNSCKSFSVSQGELCFQFFPLLLLSYYTTIFDGQNYD